MSGFPLFDREHTNIHLRGSIRPDGTHRNQHMRPLDDLLVPSYYATHSFDDHSYDASWHNRDYDDLGAITSMHLSRDTRKSFGVAPIDEAFIQGTPLLSSIFILCFFLLGLFLILLSLVATVYHLGD